MKRTVGIVGTGWVGSSVAISLLHSGAADELLLHDIRPEVAEGEAMDLAHGSSFYPSAEVRSANLDEMEETRVLVVSAGRGGEPGESRLDLLRENAAIIREIGGRLGGFPGIVVMVSNPVDVLTRIMVDASGLPPSRVVGTGTMLETSRLRQVLGRELRLDPRSIHAYVVGEHGDSKVVLWSGATIGGIPLRSWPGWEPEREPSVADEVRKAAGEIIRRKGATNHAIGLVTANLIRGMLREERRVLTVSRVQETLPGMEGVALSMPTIVGGEGATEVLDPPLSPTEREELARSGSILRRALEELESAEGG